MKGAKITALEVREQVEDQTTNILILTDEGGVAFGSRTLFLTPLPKGVQVA